MRLRKRREESFGCEYCRDSDNRYYGHVPRIDEDAERGMVLIRCPQCQTLYEESHVGDRTRQLTEEQARRLYPGEKGRRLAMIQEGLVPSFSMCGVRLGDSESEVRRVLGDPMSSRGEPAVLFLEYASITVALLDESVHMLIAEPSFTGETPEGLSVGTSWERVIETLEDVEYSEDEGLWFSPRHPGVWYEIARPAQGFEQPLDPPFESEHHEVSQPQNAFVRRMFVMS